VGQKRKDLTPERSPQHRWGAELRALRDREGLSLAQLGDRARFDRSYLARLERGDQFPSDKAAKECDRVLGAGGELVRLREAADRERRQGKAHVANAGDHEANRTRKLDLPPVDDALSETDHDGVAVPCRAADGRIIWLNVPRRTFLLGGIAATAGVAAGPLSPRTASRPALIAGGGDLTPVEHLQRMRRMLRDSDNLLGPRHIIPTVHEHIRVIKQLRAGRSGADRQALLTLQVEFAEFAGWLHQDCGDFGQAQYWLDRALEWSHASADPQMTVYVMARKSQMAGDMRDPESAIDLGDAAAAIARPGSRLNAAALTFQAHGYALAGDPLSSLRTLDRARQLAADPDNQKEPGRATWLDQAYVEAQRGRCLEALGDHKQAVTVYQQAIRDLPRPFRRDRGVYLAREAQAYAGTREPEQAATTAMEALAVAEETGSGRIVSELALLDGSLARWASLPAVADFRDALTAVIPQETDTRLD
jgi:transcriptional regulator with XRE-family HTH domain